MITLIKIRSKYLTNHYCSIYWSYFFIPSIILIFIIIIFFSRRIKEYSPQNKIEGKAFNLTKSLFSQNITFNRYKYTFISNDEKDKIILQELIKTDIEWFYQENENEEVDQDLLSKIKYYNNIIKINNKNERYKINLIQIEGYRIFGWSSNTFSYSNLFEPPYYNTEDDNHFNEFIQLQSLLAQFLIKKNGNSYSHKELDIELGNNSYPPHTDLNYNGLIIICLIISLQFTLTSYFLCLSMIEEKQKKLTY